MGEEMNVKKYEFSDFNIIEIQSIVDVHLSVAEDLFNEKARITATEAGKWNELIYCILAGTQFPVKKLKPLFANLLNYFNTNLELTRWKNENANKFQYELQIFLKDNGYRYHTQKAKVVNNAALFFNTTYDGNISDFLQNKDLNNIRQELVSSITGVGIKIASHWLRNIGYSTCTIDIHLRRLLYNLGLTDDENSKKPISKSDFLKMEMHFQKLGTILDMPVGIIQYSVWEYTRSHCQVFRCQHCKLNYHCLRGQKVISNFDNTLFD